MLEKRKQQGCVLWPNIFVHCKDGFFAKSFSNSFNKIGLTNKNKINKADWPIARLEEVRWDFQAERKKSR